MQLYCPTEQNIFNGKYFIFHRPIEWFTNKKLLTKFVSYPTGGQQSGPTSHQHWALPGGMVTVPTAVTSNYIAWALEPGLRNKGTHCKEKPAHRSTE